ncbi:MAG: hypothetical protein IJH21_01655, partial [Oscillospiraceae bacterium]|nr:hypothetical protein [Oscillospiraceae bacterium]
GGPVCGALVGLAASLASSALHPLSAAYAVTAVSLGVIIGIAARRNWFDTFYGFMKTAFPSLPLCKNSKSRNLN